jgi:hypothetical protein
MNFPVILNYLFTFSNTSAPNIKVESLFNFFREGINPNLKPTLSVYDYNIRKKIFHTYRSNNNIQIGSLTFTIGSLGTTTIDGPPLKLYSILYFTFISTNSGINFICALTSLQFKDYSDDCKKIHIPYGFNCYIDTLIQTDPIKKNVCIPYYLFLITPNPVTDVEDKQRNIPYGLTV